MNHNEPKWTKMNKMNQNEPKWTKMNQVNQIIQNSENQVNQISKR